MSTVEVGRYRLCRLFVTQNIGDIDIDIHIDIEAHFGLLTYLIIARKVLLSMTSMLFLNFRFGLVEM